MTTVSPSTSFQPPYTFASNNNDNNASQSSSNLRSDFFSPQPNKEYTDITISPKNSDKDTRNSDERMQAVFDSIKPSGVAVTAAKKDDSINAHTYSNNNDDDDNSTSSESSTSDSASFENYSCNLRFLPLFYDPPSGEFNKYKESITKRFQEVQTYTGPKTENYIKQIKKPLEDLLKHFASIRNIIKELTLGLAQLRDSIADNDITENYGKIKSITNPPQVIGDEIIPILNPQQILNQIYTYLEKLNYYVDAEEIHFLELNNTKPNKTTKKIFNCVLDSFAYAREEICSVVCKLDNPDNTNEDLDGIQDEILELTDNIELIFEIVIDETDDHGYENNLRQLLDHHVKLCQTSPRDKESLSRVTHMILSLRRQRLEDTLVLQNLSSLEDRKHAKELEVINVGKKGNEDKLLDAYIEWQRADVAVREFYKNTFARVRKLNKTNELVHCVLIGNSDEASHELIEIGQSTNILGVESPLIKLMSKTHAKCRVKKPKPRIIGGFFHSNRKINEFEEGYIKTNGKTNDNINLKNIIRVAEDGIPKTICEELPNCEFQLPQLSGIQLNCNPHWLRFERIFILLTLLLADRSKKMRRANGPDQIRHDTNSQDSNVEPITIDQGEPVACMIVSSKGEILCAVANTNDGSKTDEHAEVNVLRKFFRKHASLQFLPDDARLFTSLQSCHMCAGAIYVSFSKIRKEHVKPAIRPVVYYQKDFGQDNTLICMRNLEKQHGRHIYKISRNNEEHNYKESKELCEIDETYLKVKNVRKNVNAAKCLYEPEFDPLVANTRKELSIILKGMSDRDGAALASYLTEFVRLNGIVLE